MNRSQPAPLPAKVVAVGIWLAGVAGLGVVWGVEAAWRRLHR